MSNPESQELNKKEQIPPFLKKPETGDDLSVDEIEAVLEKQDEKFDQEGISLLREETDSTGMSPEDVEKAAEESGLKDEMSEISAEEDKLYKEAVAKVEGTWNKEQENKSYAEEARNYFLKLMQSQEYLDKLTMEVDGNADEAEKIRQERLKNVSEVPVAYFENDEKLDDMRQIITGSNSRQAGLKGYYFELKDGHNGIGLTKDRFRESATHEFSHAATSMEAGIPEKTKKMIDEIFELRLPSYRSRDMEERKMAERYYGNPSEMLARKQVVDKKMDDLGIKKYGERFELKHLFELVLAEDADMKKTLGIENKPEDELTDDQVEKIRKYTEENGYPEGFEFLNLIDITNQNEVERFFNEVAANERTSPEDRDKNNGTHA